MHRLEHISTARRNARFLVAVVVALKIGMPCKTLNPTSNPMSNPTSNQCIAPPILESRDIVVVVATLTKHIDAALLVLPG